MSIFDGMDRPGPGVYRSDQREGPGIRFFRVFALKFFTLCLCNLLFVIVNLPTLGITYMVAAFVMPYISNSLAPEALSDLISQIDLGLVDSVAVAEQAAFDFYVLSIFLGSFLIIGLTLIVSGPFQTAFCYVYRNFSRETQGFFWQDFLRALKTNWKQSLIVSVISFFVTAVLLLNVAYYATHPDLGALSSILLGVFGILFVMYCGIQMYVYPLIASLELPLKKIYRNAALFTGIRFFPTIGILILQAIILFVIPALLFIFGSEIGSTIAVVIYLTIAFSASHFLSNFFVWHQIETHLLPDESEDAQQEDAE